MSRRDWLCQVHDAMARTWGYLGLAALEGGVTALVLAAAVRGAVGAPALVIEGVTVVDVEQGRLLPAQRVVIAGRHIQAVGDGNVVPIPQGAQIVDARGK